MEPDWTNADRARVAHAALLSMPDMDDVQTGVIDLLANLRHLCDAHDLCFGDLDSMAHGHYLAELEDN